MSKKQVNAEVLYAAYQQVASTPESEDVTCGLAVGTDHPSYDPSKDADIKAHREFIGRHEKVLAPAFREGKEAFLAAVEKCIAEDNAEADAGFTHE